MGNLPRELARLERMTIPELRQRYLEVFGEEASSHNKVWLVRRLAWRLQSLAEGGLSERAQRRAAELANDADIRMYPPATAMAEPAPERATTQALRLTLVTSQLLLHESCRRWGNGVSADIIAYVEEEPSDTPCACKSEPTPQAEFLKALLDDAGVPSL